WRGCICSRENSRTRKRGRRSASTRGKATPSQNKCSRPPGRSTWTKTYDASLNRRCRPARIRLPSPCSEEKAWCSGKPQPNVNGQRENEPRITRMARIEEYASAAFSVIRAIRVIRGPKIYDHFDSVFSCEAACFLR